MPAPLLHHHLDTFYSSFSQISLIRFLLYVVFQCIGGIVGSGLQKALTCNWQMKFANSSSCGLGMIPSSSLFNSVLSNASIQSDSITIMTGMTKLGDGVSPVQGFGIELLITFVLVITVFATCDKSRNAQPGSGALAIGLSVAMCHLALVCFFPHMFTGNQRVTCYA